MILNNAGVSINGAEPVRCEISMDQESVTVESWSATKPDMAWTFVDKAGHFHAYDSEGKLPTLTAELQHKPCNGACGGVCGGEGYHVTVYRCIACRKKVKPKTVPDPGPHIIPGPQSWTLTVYAEVPDGKFSFVVDMEDRQIFGFAERHSGRVERFLDRTVVTSECHAGPVGFRKTRMVAEYKAGAAK